MSTFQYGHTAVVIFGSQDALANGGRMFCGCSSLAKAIHDLRNPPQTEYSSPP